MHPSEEMYILILDIIYRHYVFCQHISMQQQNLFNCCVARYEKYELTLNMKVYHFSIKSGKYPILSIALIYPKKRGVCFSISSSLIPKKIIT
jgi:hypothetical protein